MSFSSYPIPGVKNSIELAFRTVRLGTLRGFPIEDEKLSSADLQPLKMDLNGFVIPLSFEKSSVNETIELPASSIRSVCAHLSRGCPTLWIKPKKSWATHIQEKLGAYANNKSFIDPDSDVAEKQEVCIIADKDPLPVATQLCIKQVVFGIANDHDLNPTNFFTIISSKENNQKLIGHTKHLTNSNTNQDNTKNLASKEINFCNVSVRISRCLPVSNKIPNEVTSAQKRKSTSERNAISENADNIHSVKTQADSRSKKKTKKDENSEFKHDYEKPKKNFNLRRSCRKKNEALDYSHFFD